MLKFLTINYDLPLKYLIEESEMHNHLKSLNLLIEGVYRHGLEYRNVIRGLPRTYGQVEGEHIDFTCCVSPRYSIFGYFTLEWVLDTSSNR